MSVLKAKNAKDNCERDLKLYQQRPEMIIYTSQLVVLFLPMEHRTFNRVRVPPPHPHNKTFGDFLFVLLPNLIFFFLVKKSKEGNKI